MKIAVVGCGAVGSYYGGRLAQAGHDVHFLLRSDYEVVRQHGVSVQSPQGSFHFRPQCAMAPDEIGACDLVLIGLKTTANDQFQVLLPPLVGPHTAILTLQNGLGNEEQLAELFAAEQVLGALCFVCLNRIGPGRILHLDHGQIVLGEFQRPPQPRTLELATFFREARVPCEVTPDLAKAHWEKLVWNIPFNGLGVAAAAGLEAVTRGNWDASRPLEGCLTTDLLLGHPGWAGLVRELMLEVIAAARSLGFDVSPSLADRLLELTRTMGAYKASTLLDFERGQPMELDSLFLEPLRRAQAGRVPVPRLENLCRVLRQLDEARRARGAGPASQRGFEVR